MKREYASSGAGFKFVCGEALTATRLDAVRKFFDVAGVVLGKLSALDGFKPGTDIPAQCLKALVAFTEQSKTLANYFTGGLVHTRLDFVSDELFEFGGQGDVHIAIG